MACSLLKRQKEINSKLTELIEDNLGAKAKEMMYLNLLATAPACQGQGYGSALVQSFTDAVSAHPSQFLRHRVAYMSNSRPMLEAVLHTSYPVT